MISRTGQEALFAVGVSRHERRAAMQKIARDEPVDFGPVVWLAPEQVDDTYFNLLPSKRSEITVEEIAELSAVFGEGGELQGERLS